MTIRNGLLCMLVVAAAVAGCNQYRGRTIDTGRDGLSEVPRPNVLGAKPNPVISDLPVPVGFKMVEGKSRSMAVPGMRMVDHYYRGRANKWAVGKFYHRQMEASGWKQAADRMFQGILYMDFVKNNNSEFCGIVIRSASFGGTEIQVAIYPLVGRQTPRSK